ncbi:hypothetical protein Efla_000063 [Eimeria flavescens]
MAVRLAGRFSFEFRRCTDIAERMMELTEQQCCVDLEKSPKPQNRKRRTRGSETTNEDKHQRAAKQHSGNTSQSLPDAAPALVGEEDAWLDDLCLNEAAAALLKDTASRVVARARQHILSIKQEGKATPESTRKVSLYCHTSRRVSRWRFRLLISAGGKRKSFHASGPSEESTKAAVLHVYLSLLGDPDLSGFVQATPAWRTKLTTNGWK